MLPLFTTQMALQSYIHTHWALLLEIWTLLLEIKHEKLQKKPQGMRPTIAPLPLFTTRMALQSYIHTHYNIWALLLEIKHENAAENPKACVQQ